MLVFIIPIIAEGTEGDIFIKLWMTKLTIKKCIFFILPAAIPQLYGRLVFLDFRLFQEDFNVSKTQKI